MEVVAGPDLNHQLLLIQRADLDGTSAQRYHP
jgi:hypothetical protein